MDNLTHTLAGALVGAALAPRQPDGRSLSLPMRMLVGALAANLPDLDILAAPFVAPLAYLNVHRGITHSLLLLPLWTLAVAWLAHRMTRHRHRFTEFALVIGVALASHVLLDLVTAYGTRILAPLDDTPYSFALMFIIDLWFTLILAVGLALAWRRGSARAAGVALGVALSWLLVQAVFHNQATALATLAAEAWGPETRVAVLPQPLSPANWKLVLVKGEEYRIAHVNLLASGVTETPEDAGLVRRVWSAYRPGPQLDWQAYHQFGEDKGWRRFARAAWSQPEFTEFRRFALLPHLEQVEDRKLAGCGWFSDLRFRVPGTDRDPFRYGVCHAFEGGWHVESANQQQRRRPGD
jgi:inner membrane protein